MTALEIMPTSGKKTPFGVDDSIIWDDKIDFSAGVIATFVAPNHDGDLRPDNGLYTPTIRYFNVFIGNTHWDETLFNSEPEFQVQGGLVTGVRFTITQTKPGHPDLECKYPSSPGRWNALDERDEINLGTISGNYVLRDGIVDEASDFPWHLLLPAFIERLKPKNSDR